MEGLIYRIQSYQENDRLLYVYTARGKITLLAQGSQKINSHTRILSQYLTYITFDDQMKPFQRLKDARLIDGFEGIKEDYQKTKSASIILEIIDKVIDEEQQHALILKLALEALQTDHLEESALSFALKVLKGLGYQLNMTADGRKVKGFCIAKGSIIYEEDAQSVDLDIEETIVVLKLLKLPFMALEVLDQKTKKKILEFIFNYYIYHTETKLKSLR